MFGITKNIVLCISKKPVTNASDIFLAPGKDMFTLDVSSQVQDIQSFEPLTKPKVALPQNLKLENCIEIKSANFTVVRSA